MYNSKVYCIFSYVTLHEKPYFLFPNVLKRWSFQKKIALEYDLFCIIRKDVFLFLENIILLSKRKMKDDLSQKIHENMIFSSNTPKRWSFQKKDHSWIWSFLYYLERWRFFFHKIYFFFGRKMEDDLSQEIHVNMIFSVYMYKSYKYDILSKKYT